jgi:bacterioferritin
MQGNPTITDKLQRILANELAASDQYFIHSRMLADWGFFALAERMDHESLEERSHADKIIQRMLFLEAKPDMSQRDGLNVGTTVPEMIAKDLTVEMGVRELLLDLIDTCEELKDYQTRETLLPLLNDTEEDHILFLETQQRLIASLGLQNYLQSQKGSEPTA